MLALQLHAGAAWTGGAAKVAPGICQLHIPGNSAQCEAQRSKLERCRAKGLTLSGHSWYDWKAVRSGPKWLKCRMHLAAADAAVVHRHRQLPCTAHHSCLQLDGEDLQGNVAT